MALQVALREKRDVTILDVAGDLVAPDCSALTNRVKELLATGKTKIALNLKDVRRADSLGLGSLAASFISAQRQDGALKLCSPNDVVYQSLQDTLIDRVIEVYFQEEDALASFN